MELLWWLSSSICSAGDVDSIPLSGRSPGEGSGNQLQYFCLENPQGQRSLAGYSPLELKDLDMAEWLSTAHNIYVNTHFMLEKRTAWKICIIAVVRIIRWSPRFLVFLWVLWDVTVVTKLCYMAKVRDSASILKSVDFELIRRKIILNGLDLIR